MALITCPHCGTQVSHQIATCPQCGLPMSEAGLPPGNAALGKNSSAHTSVLPVLVGAILVASVVAVVWSIHRHMTETAANVTAPAARDQEAMEARFNESVRRATLGDINLHHAQLDPASYKLDKATLMEDGTICYRYHAREESGDVIAKIAVLKPGGTAVINDSPTTQAAWSESCSKQTGKNLTLYQHAGA